MNRFARSSVLSLLLGCFLLPATASAVGVTLQNDGFVGGGATFQAGFVAGEIAASRFDPPGPFPMNLTEVNFLFGDIAIQSIVILHIWEDDAGANSPGTELYSEAFIVVGSAAALNAINLSGAGVQVNGPFRVGLEFTDNGLPSIARDNDGTIDSANNFLFASGIGWFPSSLFGLTGDWILRAVVEVPTTDAPAQSELARLTMSPNPFNPATELRFELPADGPVTIRVYDLRGREVDSVLEGSFLPAGPQSIPYRTSLSSGVYLMRATSGSWYQTTKFTVVQ